MYITWFFGFGNLYHLESVFYDSASGRVVMVVEAVMCDLAQPTEVYIDDGCARCRG